MRLKQSCVVVLLLSLFAARAAAGNEPVVIRGTASMLHLCQSLISLYEAELHGVQIGVNVSDSVEALPTGGSTIWQTVHPLDRQEKRQLQERFGSKAHEIPIGIEGIVVIVNKANPVGELTVEQLRAIYTRKTANWKEVGGREGAIHLYSTEAIAGGSLFFTDLVLQGEEIDTAMRGYVSPKETETAVAMDPAGIGLIPLPADKDVKYPLIRRTATMPGVEASAENIRTLRYPLSSYVYWVFAGEHAETITQFVRFTLSGRGQLAVEAAGYYPLAPSDRTRAAEELVASRR